MSNFHGQTPTNPWINNNPGVTNNSAGVFNQNQQNPYVQTNPYLYQQNRFASLPGRVVGNVDEITPQEVPMDGSVSLFPQNDYSAIYAKTWTKDGTIATVKFIPEQSQMEPQKSPLEERLDRIDQRFDKLEKMLSNRNKSRKPYNKINQTKEEQNNA